MKPSPSTSYIWKANLKILKVNFFQKFSAVEKGNCTLTSAFQSFRPCCQKCWAPAETLWSPRPHCHPCRTHLQKCEKQSTMVFLIKNLQLSWQGGCFGVLEAREAPAGSTFQSCRSPACETWSFREWWYQRNWWINRLFVNFIDYLSYVSISIITFCSGAWPLPRWRKWFR